MSKIMGMDCFIWQNKSSRLSNISIVEELFTSTYLWAIYLLILRGKSKLLTLGRHCLEVTFNQVKNFLVVLVFEQPLSFPHLKTSNWKWELQNLKSLQIFSWIWFQRRLTLVRMSILLVYAFTILRSELILLKDRLGRKFHKIFLQKVLILIYCLLRGWKIFCEIFWIKILKKDILFLK